MPSAQWELAVRSEAASLNQIMYMILFLLERKPFEFKVPHRTASPQRLPHQQRPCVSTNTIQEYRIPATGFTDPPVTRQLQSLPLQGREGSELPPPVSNAGYTSP